MQVYSEFHYKDYKTQMMGIKKVLFKVIALRVYSNLYSGQMLSSLVDGGRLT